MIRKASSISHLLNLQWASSSCQIFEKFSCAIQWIMQAKYHAAGMSHIIDDFLFVGPPNSDKSLHEFAQLTMTTKMFNQLYYCVYSIIFNSRIFLWN
jgi:hypothetical protein